MSQHETRERAEVSIDESSVFIAHDEDLEALKHRFEDAARNGPRFVEFRTAAGSMLGALITPQSRIIVTVHQGPAADVAEVLPSEHSDWDL